MSKNKNKFPVNNNEDNNDATSKSGETILAIRKSIHLGPLPSAEQLKQYKDISADLPERIMAMAEKEQNIRLENSKNIVKHNYRLQYLGLFFGFVLSSMTIIFGFILILNGQQGFGAFISLLGFSGIIRTFINSSKQTK